MCCFSLAGFQNFLIAFAFKQFEYDAYLGIELFEFVLLEV